MIIFLKKKRSRGSIAFGAVLAVVLVIIGLAFFALAMYMGGQNETKNATDAGMLNVGKKVADNVSVPIYPTPNELIFIDVANDTTSGEDLLASLTGGISDLKEINMHRINRVWPRRCKSASMPKPQIETDSVGKPKATRRKHSKAPNRSAIVWPTNSMTSLTGTNISTN